MDNISHMLMFMITVIQLTEKKHDDDKQEERIGRNSRMVFRRTDVNVKTWSAAALTSVQCCAPPLLPLIHGVLVL